MDTTAIEAFLVKLKKDGLKRNIDKSILEQAKVDFIAKIQAK